MVRAQKSVNDSMMAGSESAREPREPAQAIIKKSFVRMIRYLLECNTETSEKEVTGELSTGCLVSLRHVRLCGRVRIDIGLRPPKSDVQVQL